MLYKCGNAKVRLYKMWDNYNFWNHETSATYMIYDKGIIKYDEIFDKYSLWDQGVRADDRDWLL